MSDIFEQRSNKVMNLIIGIVGSVGLIGLALALVGLYAVVAYNVARRTREIGIRMAIGADRRQVVRMVLKQAAWMGVTGVVIGSALSILAGRGLSTALKVPAFDPLLFATTVLGLLVTALLAAAIPASRAAQIDPMQAMRQD